MHDLRNRLAAIHSAAEMLTEADLSPAHAKRLARNIFCASRRTQALLQDLLNLSRGESSAPQPSSLREVAETACELLSLTAESYGSTLIVEIQPEIELSLVRSRMQRVFVNMIGNAIEAMPRAEKYVSRRNSAADSVLVHVDDTGPGVVPEIRSQLFQPFVTARETL